MADILGTLVVQDLTFTQAQHGTEFTVTYLNGGIAGQEVVTWSGTDVFVKIASGTSTAAQILAAWNACDEAVTIATVAVSGTAGDAQVSAVEAYQSGGANALKAAAPVAYSMRLEARTAGTAGNSITFVFSDTGTVSASAIGNAITITVDDLVTTYQEVRDALAEDAGCSNLVGVFNSEDLHQYTVNIVADGLPVAPENLTGGTAAVSPAVLIQDLTWTSTTPGPTSLRQHITYTHGATAGAEVVTLDANGNETIQIENGVSTATQIKAAHDAVPAALALRTVAITGVGGNPQFTVNQEEPVVGEETLSTKDYFADQDVVALTTSYEPQYFHFHADSIFLYNDSTTSTDYMEWSLNGTDTGGRLYGGEQIVMDHLGNGRAVISLRSVPADIDYRLEVTGV